jgi:polyphosphate glucokinase
VVEQPRVLVVDVGGSHIKVLATGESESRRVTSGPTLTPEEMVAAALELAQGWRFDVVSLGVPAPVHGGRVVSEPHNLGRGWVGFDFGPAFGHPTKVMNDAAMQALGSHHGGTMLFLGLGTGLGSALVTDDGVESMELGHLPFKKGTYEDYVGERGRKRFGDKRWRKLVAEVVEEFRAVFLPESIVLGGGNAKRLDELPDGARLGSNTNAFTGGFRLWRGPAPLALARGGGPDDPDRTETVVPEGGAPESAGHETEAPETGRPDSD